MKKVFYFLLIVLSQNLYSQQNKDENIKNLQEQMTILKDLNTSLKNNLQNCINMSGGSSEKIKELTAQLNSSNNYIQSLVNAKRIQDLLNLSLQQKLQKSENIEYLLKENNDLKNEVNKYKEEYNKLNSAYLKILNENRELKSKQTQIQSKKNETSTNNCPIGEYIHIGEYDEGDAYIRIETLSKKVPEQKNATGFLKYVESNGDYFVQDILVFCYNKSFTTNRQVFYSKDNKVQRSIEGYTKFSNNQPNSLGSNLINFICSCD